MPAPVPEALRFLSDVVRNLPDGDQLAYVLQRIAQRADCAVVLFDARGDLLGAVGEAPVKLLWEHAVEAEPDDEGRVGRWAVRVRRSGPSGGVFTLVLATKTEVAVHTDAELIAAADIAITAVLGIVRGTDVRRARDNAQLLETLELGIPAAREHRYWPRLVEFGFVAHTAFLLVVWESWDGSVPDSEFVAGALDDAAAAGVPLLLATRLIRAAHDSVVHALLPDSGAAREWLRRWSPRRTIGVSPPHSRLDEVPAALREAELAHRVALERRAARERHGMADPAVGELVDYGAMPLAEWLACQTGPAELRARGRALLAPLDGHDELRQTLLAYLAADLSVPRVAEHLFIHANTVRYRLSRIEQLLDASLDSPLFLGEAGIVLGAEVRAYRSRLE